MSLAVAPAGTHKDRLRLSSPNTFTTYEVTQTGVTPWRVDTRRATTDRQTGGMKQKAETKKNQQGIQNPTSDKTLNIGIQSKVKT